MKKQNEDLTRENSEYTEAFSQMGGLNEETIELSKDLE